MNVQLPTETSTVWRAWITRSTDSPCSALYRHSSRDAARYFLRWLSATEHAAFPEMLCSMHSTLVGHMRHHPTLGYDPQDRYPGTLRDARVATGDVSAAEGQVMIRNPVAYGAYDRAARRKRATGGRSLVVLDYGACSYRFVLQIAPDGLTLPIAGVPPHHFPRVVPLGPERFGIRPAACPDGFGAYLRAASETLSVLRGWLRSTASTRDSKRFLRRLGRYHQQGLILHPFLAQNNALLMNQVNCMLHAAGWPPQFHAMLDAFAYVMPSSAYERLFTDHVAGKVFE